ncbi:Doxorubicin resistance ATP-binding protein DrrA [Anaerohalosphaera lusitana]|uniref:Doxorubicin resistance ATP-binding protein DrrA n=1 Tax=Anaerohalosphaera lusitana TaxID=1936003 RepID=A0A1U9NPA0_9BACT|nr:ABC transporter ATP-binding protein [Anaerohalosphaera lusitana]AQT69665.1 Doxorubicin resistance ATP-binding protein DrrA [Anaerohalosphaera lusitana]
MGDKVIVARDVNKSYGAVRAVSDLSFEVEEAKCFGLLGPNGAGKTTMMKMVYGKSVGDKNGVGELKIFGYEPPKEELQIKYLSGVVPQEDNLDEELNIRQNLLVYSKFYDMPEDKAKERIAELLEFMELTARSKARIRELSGGMKRRLVIARALLNRPRLLILDEPTTGLDPQVRHVIWDKIRQLKKQGTTVLLTTHYMEEAFQLCDRLLIMHRGVKVMEGVPRSLLRDNVERYVLELFEHPPVGDLLGKEVLDRVRVEVAGDVTRLFSEDMDLLKTVADEIGGHYYMREANLEDVFLKATGSTLGAQQ